MGQRFQSEMPDSL